MFMLNDDALAGYHVISRSSSSFLFKHLNKNMKSVKLYIVTVLDVSVCSVDKRKKSDDTVLAGF